MGYLDLDAIAAAPLQSEPFEHILVPAAVPERNAAAITRDYPEIEAAGSFALSDVHPGQAVLDLIAELDGPEFRELMQARFGVELEGRPTMFTLRGKCAARDGKIHTDSKSKILSILLYLNEGWAPEGGRLRLLKTGADLESPTVEVPPHFGSMLVFKRSDHSWHGHKPFVGVRRVLQMNYVHSARTPLVSDLRHRLSALVKRATAA